MEKETKFYRFKDGISCDIFSEFKDGVPLDKVDEISEEEFMSDVSGETISYGPAAGEKIKAKFGWTEDKITDFKRNV